MHVRARIFNAHRLRPTVRKFELSPLLDSSLPTVRVSHRPVHQVLKTDRQEKPNFERIAQALGGTKTVAKVAQYHYDWKKRHPPMRQYLQSFSSEYKEPAATSAGMTDATDVGVVVASAKEDGIISLSSGHQDRETELTASEHVGLQNVSSRTRIWTLSELTALYKSARVRGEFEFTLICDGMAGSKSADQIRTFMKNWKSRTQYTFVNYVQSFDATDIADNANVGNIDIDGENEHATGTEAATDTDHPGEAPAREVEPQPAGGGLRKEDSVSSTPGVDNGVVMVTVADHSPPSTPLELASCPQPQKLEQLAAELNKCERLALKRLASRRLSTWTYDELVVYYLTLCAHGSGYKGVYNEIAQALVSVNLPKTRKQTSQFMSDWTAGVKRKGGGRSFEDYVQSFTDKAAQPSMEPAAAPSAEPSSEPTADELTESEKLGLLDLAARSTFWSYEELTVYYAIIKVHGSASGHYSTIAEALNDAKSDKTRKKVREFTNNFAVRKGVAGRTMQAYLQSFASENVVELTSSEQLGLRHLASRTSVWNYAELATYYSVLKRKGPDFECITTNLAGSKTLQQVTSYWTNWKHKDTGLSIQEYLQGFGSIRQPHAVPAAAVVASQPGAQEAAQPASADLTESERRGLSHLASKHRTIWSLDELQAYYLALREHGNNTDKITEAIGGTKTKEQVQKYATNFRTK